MSKYKSKWEAVDKDALADLNWLRKKQKKSLITEAWKRSLRARESVYLLITHHGPASGWRAYVIFEECRGHATGTLDLGWTAESWVNLAMRMAVVRAKKFFRLVGGLEL